MRRSYPPDRWFHVVTLAATAQDGDRLATLRDLRDMLAADLEGCESMRDKAALSQRFMDVLEQIAGIEKAQPAQKGTALDEFTRRRADKQATSAKVPARNKQRG